MTEAINSYVIMAIVLICLCVGYIIKNAIPTDKINRFIPLIVGLLGVFLNIWMSGWEISPTIILGGLISGLSSTGMYEAFRQIISGGKNG